MDFQTKYNEIQQLELKAARLSEEIRTGQQRMDVIEAEYVLFISSETDGAGKPLYSNEKTRAARLTLLLAEHTEYQKLLTVAADLRIQRTVAEGWLYAAKNELRLMTFDAEREILKLRENLRG